MGQTSSTLSDKGKKGRRKDRSCFPGTSTDEAGIPLTGPLDEEKTEKKTKEKTKKKATPKDPVSASTVTASSTSSAASSTAPSGKSIPRKSIPALKRPLSKDGKEMEAKKALPLTDKTSALRCLKSLEEYRKDARLKATPGLVFKETPVFRPLEPDSVIDHEIEDIGMLAERLHALRLTIERDSTALALSGSAPVERASLVRATSRARISPHDLPKTLGEDWSRVDSQSRKALDGALQRLNRAEREIVLGVLQSLEQVLAEPFQALQQRRQKTQNYWLQAKMAVKMGSFRSSTDSVTPKPEEKTTPTGDEPHALAIDLPAAYQAALRADDQRTGWAKLTASDDSKSKETKEIKEKKSTEKKSETSSVRPSEGSPMPPALESLRQDLAKWLCLDQDISVVQRRLAGIRDYCRLVNRLTDTTAHLAHDTQLARQILAQFKREALKDHPALVMAVCQLAAAQDPELTKTLLGILTTSLKESALLEAPLLSGVARVLHHARAEHVSLGDLGILLTVLVERSRNLGSDLAEAEVLQLLQALGSVLSSMALISQHRAVQQAVWQSQQLKTLADESKDSKDSKEHKYDEAPPVGRIRRGLRWLQDKQQQALKKIDGPADQSGLATIDRDAYEKLCQTLAESVIKAAKSRFDLSAARREQPELVFALSLIRQALMRLAHREPTRSQRLLEGAQLFFDLVTNAQEAVTNFSLSALWDAGNTLMDFINATPLGDKLHDLMAEEDDQPQAWFEHYLGLKTLVESDQLIKLEELLIEGGQFRIVSESKSDQGFTWNYWLTQGLLQLLEQIARWDGREPVRQAGWQCLSLLHHKELWQWPEEQKDFKAIQDRSRASLDKAAPQSGASSLEQRRAQQTSKDSQAHSQRLLRKARRECQESDLSYQLHDYYVLQVRQARQDPAWQQDDKRYIPALAKSSLAAEEDSAGLFYPAFQDFLQSGSTPTAEVKEMKEVKEVKSETKTDRIIPLRTQASRKTALLILGDAGTGKSLFIRRHHLSRCRSYFSRQLEGNRDGDPLSFHVILNQTPVEAPLEYYLTQQGFTEDHIRALRSSSRLIIHLDGYDEWSSEGQSPWVFGPKSLGDWVSSSQPHQVIITCRSQYLQGNRQYPDLFTPPPPNQKSSYGQALDKTAFSEWVITRLDPGGVERLAQYYVADEQAQGHTPFSVKAYLQQFQASGISELVRTPIILLMALQVLPALRKRQGEGLKILRLDIYQEFIRQYMQAQRQKQQERGWDMRGVIEAAERYAIQLSLAFFREDKAGVSYQPPSPYSFAPESQHTWDRFFAPQHRDTTLSSVVPLRVTTQRNVQESTTVTQYSFIHKSMLDYFTARGLYEGLKALTGCLQEPPPQSPIDHDRKQTPSVSLDLDKMALPYLALTVASGPDSVESSRQLFSVALQWHALQAFAEQKSQWEKSQRQRRESSPWNARAINAEQSVIEFLGEILAAETRIWEKEQAQAQAEQKAPPGSLVEVKSTVFSREVLDHRTPKRGEETDEKSSGNLRVESKARPQPTTGLPAKAPEGLVSSPGPRQRFKERMIELMHASRAYPELQQASANAATILCRLDIGVFGGFNFSGIRLPGADLAGSYWDQVDFRGVDFSGVNLRSVWMSHCQLPGARLAGIQLGEFPSIEAKDRVHAMVMHPREPHLMAIAAGNDIVIYDRAACQVVRTLTGHTDWIRCLSYAPDGQQLASGSEDHTVRLWDPKGEKPGQVLAGHTHDVLCLTYAPDGQQLASGSNDETVRLWDPKGEKPSQVLAGHTDTVRCLAYAPDGQQLASGSKDETVRLWDPKGEKPSQVLAGHTDGIGCLAYAPDGQQLASGSWDKTVRLWDPQGEKPSQVLAGHTDTVRCLAYAPDGQQLASGSKDETVRLWDPKGEKPSQVLAGHKGSVNCLSYAPDGQQLASGSWDKTVRLWDPKGEKPSQVLAGHMREVRCLAYAPDGQQLASGSWDKTVRLWDPKGEKPSQVLAGHTRDVYCLSYAPDGQQLASGSWDHTVRLWDPKGEKPSQVLVGHTKQVQCLSYAPDGQQLASGSMDQTVRLWDPKGEKPSQVLKGHEDEVLCLSYAPDGQQLASGSEDNTVRLWDPKGEKPSQVLRGHEGVVSCLSYAPDGQQLASGSDDNTVRLWDPQGEKPSQVLAGHTENVYCLAYAPDGRQLASGSSDSTVWLWDPKGEKPSQVLAGHTNYVWCLAYAPDGQQLASGSLDKTVRLWDPKGEKPSQVLKGHTSDVWCLSYAPDGQQLASGSKDKTVRLWDTQSGACLLTWQAPGEVNKLLWRVDSLFLGCDNGIVAALRRHSGQWTLAWLHGGNLPILDFSGCDLSGVQGLQPFQKVLMEQRGAKTEIETKSLTTTLSTLPSSIKTPPSPATAQPALFSQSARQSEAKETKSTASLPPIPVYQGPGLLSSMAADSVTRPLSRERRHSSPAVVMKK